MWPASLPAAMWTRPAGGDGGGAARPTERSNCWTWSARPPASLVKPDSGGRAQPVKNANITVCGSPACDPPKAYVVATGRSDDAGRYTVGFLRAGAYTVRVEQPDYPSLGPAIIPNVHITAGDTTQLPVSLPSARSGGAYVRISGPPSVGVRGPISLHAPPGDASGNPGSNPSVS